MIRRPIARAATTTAVATTCLLAAVTAWLAPPVRYEVDGLSMAPGLLPGDIVGSGVVPIIDRLRQPQRFERWIVDPPGDGVAIKRLVGLPGETVSIANGDLAIDGRICLKPPRMVAETAVDVPRSLAPRHERHVRFDATEVLDDVDFATEVNRELLPVRDVGVAVIVGTAESGTRIRIGVGDTQITWRLPAHRRGCFVAGRLDGHLVATGWRLHGAPAQDDRHCLPASVPDSWTLASPWPDGDATAAAPAMSIDVDEDTAIVERLTRWRDILYRPAADGHEQWQLGGDEFLMLGDFPTGSRDSRHWGPLNRAALQHRVHGVALSQPHPP